MADKEIQSPGYEQQDRALLEAFAPLLRETVIPSTIIAHLMALLSQAEVSAILGEERSAGPGAAMQRLLMVLQTCGKPGWFQALLDALEHSRYEHIRDIIKGRRTGWDMTFFKRLLAVCAPNLQRIVAVDMLPHLSCLTDDDKVLVQNEARNHGNSRAVVTLLDRVTRREPGWFQQFVTGLRQTGFDDIAEQLEDCSTAPEDVLVGNSLEDAISGTVSEPAGLFNDDGACPLPLPLLQNVGLALSYGQKEGYTKTSGPSTKSTTQTEHQGPTGKQTIVGQAISLIGRLTGKEGQVQVLGRTISYHVEGTVCEDWDWKYFGEARDEESGRWFCSPEAYHSPISAIREAVDGVLKILMADGIVESMERNIDELVDFDTL